MSKLNKGKVRKLKPKIITGSTPTPEKIDNQRILKAIVIGINKQTSNQLEEDPFNGIMSSKSILTPPLPLNVLARLPENSSELVQVIEAMETNIEGFGHRLVLDPDLEENEKLKKERKSEIDAEKIKLKILLKTINLDEDLTSLRRKLRKDEETIGNAYWEILPVATNDAELSCLNHVDAATIRITKQDDDATEVRKKYLDENFNMKTKVFFKRFRRFVQMRGNKKMFFKEWNDPRNINKFTGDPIEDADLKNAKEKKKLATALKHFKIHTTTNTPYGLPRLIGNLFSIWGSRASDEINYATFKNNNVPSMIISVSNGQFTQGSIDRMQEYMNSQIKNSDNMSKFLILEAETQEDPGITHPGTMQIKIDPLQNTQIKDQLFQNYDGNNADKIRRAFRLPGIFVGITKDVDKNTAIEMKRLADEQVFAPERRERDREINEILIKFGFKYWRIKSNSPQTTDNESLTKILATGEKTGGISPQIARETLSEVLNRDLPEVKGIDPDIPFSMQLAKELKRLVSANGEQMNQQNMGTGPKQVVEDPKPPTPKNKKSKKKSKKKTKRKTPRINRKSLELDVGKLVNDAVDIDLLPTDDDDN